MRQHQAIRRADTNITVSRDKNITVFSLRNKQGAAGIGLKLIRELHILFPRVARRDMVNMVVCVTEIAHNAIKSEEQFPVEIRLERTQNALFCSVKEAKPFPNPKSIKLPGNLLAEDGRGLFTVKVLTGNKLRIDGEHGTVSFEYELSKSREGLERRHPMTEKIAV